jgi:DNA (cytosine-5)-methyltransferase 1
MGYHRAGFEVVGVDIEPQPNYPFRFVQGNALEWLEWLNPHQWDAIHASPPCQDWSSLKATTGHEHGTGWMLHATIALLEGIGKPWVVENVGQADLSGWYHIVLCGSSFGLRVRRHRRFASSVFLMAPECNHRGQPRAVDVTGHGAQGREYKRRRELGVPMDTQADRREAMAIDWMNRDELAQAIPPAYTEYIGAQLRAPLGERAA